MGVAEGIDVENVDVSWRQEKVLDEGGEHVPGVEEEEGDKEVEDVGGEQGDDEREEDLVLPNVGDGEGVGRDFGLDGFNCNEDGCEHQVSDQG